MGETIINPDIKNTFPWKLAVIFILFSGAIIIMGTYYYRYEKNRIFEEQEKNLSAIASLKIKQISQWYSDKLSDAAVIKNNEPLVSRITQFFNDENQTGIRKEIKIWLEALNTQYDYNSVALLDTLLRVKIATSNADPLADDIVRRELINVIRYHRIILTDLHRTGTSQTIRMDLLVPLFDSLSNKQKTIGLILLCIDPDKILFPLVQSWPTPSKSSETLILRREGDSVVYLNELRHRKNTALKLKFPLSKKNLLAAKAMNGFEGVTEGIDYRDVPVIGALSKISGLPWYLVAKTDKKEVLESFQRYSVITVVVIILLIIMNFLVFGYWVWAQYLKIYRLQLNDEISLRKSEELLNKQYYTLKGIVESSGGPIFSLDRNYCYTSFNKSHALTMKLLYGADIGIGKSMLDYQANSDDRIKAKENIDRALSGENIEKWEWSGDDPDTRRFFEVIHNPIINDKNEVIGVAINARDLTDRKKAEEKLKQSEVTLQSIIDNSNSLIYLIDTEGRFVLVNQHLQNILSVSGELLIGQTREAFLPKVIADMHRKNDLEVIKTGKTQIFEEENHEPDGIHIYLTTKFPLFNDQNEIYAIGGLSTDITELKKIEKTLTESEERFRSLYENVTIGIYRTTSDGRILMANPALLSMLGFDSIEQLKNRNLEHEGYESHYPRSKFLETINSQGKIIGLESAWNKQDGSTLFVRESAIAVKDAEGRMLYYDGTVEDITDWKKAEEALVESEEKFKYIFDHSVIGKSITMPSGEINVNQSFCDIMGYTREELEKTKWQDITHPADVELTENVLKSILAGKSDSARLMKRYIHKNGDIIWTDVSTALRRDENGNPLYFLSAIIDITERKRAEESLRLKNFVFDDSIAANSISDMNGVLTEVNSAFLRIWGYQVKDEVIGKSLACLIKETSDANMIVAALNLNGEWEGDYSALRKDGSTFIAHGLATVVKDEKGRGIGYQSAVLDVTDAKRTEEKIKNQLAELKRFNGSMVDREIRMIQLKQEINAFCNQLNLPEKYSIPKAKD